MHHSDSVLQEAKTKEREERAHDTWGNHIINILIKDMIQWVQPLFYPEPVAPRERSKLARAHERASELDWRAREHFSTMHPSIHRNVSTRLRFDEQALRTKWSLSWMKGNSFHHLSSRLPFYSDDTTGPVPAPSPGDTRRGSLLAQEQAFFLFCGSLLASSASNVRQIMLWFAAVLLRG